MKSAEEAGSSDNARAEALARVMHDNYVRQQLAKGDTQEQNPSLVPWEELAESLKDSNRRFAAGIREKLERVGCALVPVGSGHAEAPFRFSDEEVELLARMEHDRWATDLVRDGWSPGAAKDEARRQHDLLVPWSELSERERDKDRASIRGLPEMLWRAGYAIRRVR